MTGTYVLEVNSGSNGDSAGFISGDCILEVEGTNISTSEDIPSISKKHKVGNKLNITILRSSEKISLALVLKEIRPGS